MAHNDNSEDLEGDTTATEESDESIVAEVEEVAT